MRIYSIYDSKAQYFGTPVFQRNAAEAIRSFSKVVNDGRSLPSDCPEDFVLFELGEFDEQTGKVIPHAAPLSLTGALQLKEGVSPVTPSAPSPVSVHSAQAPH